VVKVKSFDLDSDLGQATLDGQAVDGMRSYRIGGHIVVPELHHLRPLLAKLVPELPSERIPGGKLQITGQVEGNPQKIRINARVNGGNLALEPVTVESLELNGSGRSRAQPSTVKPVADSPISTTRATDFPGWNWRQT
jgi:autotransporter translocation and assembly factor TamB